MVAGSLLVCEISGKRTRQQRVFMMSGGGMCQLERALRNPPSDKTALQMKRRVTLTSSLTLLMRVVRNPVDSKTNPTTRNANLQ